MSAAADVRVEQDRLRADYVRVRRHSLDLVQGLSAEDCMLQSMEEASPLKWHLGHTTWFFETFVLELALRDLRPFEPTWRPLFNSYYLSLGEPLARARRGLLSRPGLDEVRAWRSHVDTRVLALLATALAPELRQLLALGLQHEQQHQELMLTDIKHHFWSNPLHPAYRPEPVPEVVEAPVVPAGLSYRPCAGGLVEIGHAGSGFAFDNEGPRHRCWLPPFELANRLVTNGEYLAFMVDGGYGRPELWLSDGWRQRTQEGWHAPLYWLRCREQWCQYTLAGLRPLRLQEPVCHVSFYEADAYARWARARLPAEAEWEHAVASWQALAGSGSHEGAVGGECAAGGAIAVGGKSVASGESAVSCESVTSGAIASIVGSAVNCESTESGETAMSGASAMGSKDPRPGGAAAPVVLAGVGGRAEAEGDVAVPGSAAAAADAAVAVSLHPEPAAAGDAQCFGTVWQWTQSAYLPYPGFRTLAGPVGEYNGKFMSNQMVLRGSSCLTPPGHARPTYRNFLPPSSRWQCTGIRLARDLP